MIAALPYDLSIDPPDDLDEAERAEWRRIVEDLASWPLEFFRPPITAASLARHCRWRVEWQRGDPLSDEELANGLLEIIEVFRPPPARSRPRLAWDRDRDAG